MATQKQINDFIKIIAPIIQEHAKKNGYKIASAIIAQACLESAYGLSGLSANYYNYFGLKCGSAWKGKSVNLATKEEYTKGTLTSIKDNFRVYDNMAAGVAGYFEFISTTRYKNLKTAKTAQEYLERIKADGYATSSTYVANNMALVEKYNLTKYDDFSKVAQEKKKTTKKTAKKTEEKKEEKKPVNKIKVDPAMEKSAALAGKYKAIVDVNMRAGAGPGKEIIKVIKKNQTVNNYGYYTEHKNVKWLYVEADGAVGFICKKYLKK